MGGIGKAGAGMQPVLLQRPTRNQSNADGYEPIPAETLTTSTSRNITEHFQIGRRRGLGLNCQGRGGARGRDRGPGVSRGA